MKILKVGDLTKLKTINIWCPKCGSNFEAYETECAKTLICNNMYAHSVKCPVCSFHIVDLEENNDQS